jgi:hypothetical protein
MASPGSGGVAAFERRNVGNVHLHLGGAVHVEHLVAWALPETMRGLARSIARRLKPLASIPERIFSCGPIPRITPSLKIGLGALRQEHPPSLFEFGAGIIERRRRAGLVFARMRARIEAAAPFSRVGVVRVADALGDRPGVDIAVINLPALMPVVCGSAAGKFGHGGY